MVLRIALSAATRSTASTEIVRPSGKRCVDFVVREAAPLAQDVPGAFKQKIEHLFLDASDALQSSEHCSSSDFAAAEIAAEIESGSLLLQNDLHDAQSGAAQSERIT